MKKITVFTSTRAEYGLMKHLIKKLQKENYIKLSLIVTSTHLDPKFGNTINEIKSDGINPNYVVPISLESKTKKDMCKQASEVIKIVSDYLQVDDVKPESHLVDDLGADDFDIVELTIAIQDATGTSISSEEEANVKTVGDFIKIVESKSV